MHFTLQFEAFHTRVPSLYQPHDLQHLHFPEFFSRDQLRERARKIQAWSSQATRVVAMTTWGRDDLIGGLGLDPDRVVVVPWAPVVDYYPIVSDVEIAATRRKWDLPGRFVLFPAQTWKHKNHLRLIEALASLKSHGDRATTLVCTGMTNDFYLTIERAVAEARLTGDVRFLGYVEPLEMRCLYRLATCLVFPSLFEGWGMPVLEAFREGLPVACSTATVLPAIVGDAALLFDPTDPDAIARSIRLLMSDDAMRAEYRARGHARAAGFSWDRTARLLRAHYREIAGLPLGLEDQALLAAPPLV